MLQDSKTVCVGGWMYGSPTEEEVVEAGLSFQVEARKVTLRLCGGDPGIETTKYMVFVSGPATTLVPFLEQYGHWNWSWANKGLVQ